MLEKWKERKDEGRGDEKTDEQHTTTTCGY